VTAVGAARHIEHMVRPSDDTDPDTLGVLDELYRAMPPAEKLRRVRDLTLAASQLGLSGLRARHPHEAESDLLLRLARLRLGPQLVDEAYGAERTSR
jgi:hypothetical protein